MFGVPFDRAVKYHRWFGAISMLAVAIHAGAWYIKWCGARGERRCTDVHFAAGSDIWIVWM